jgi:DNA-binding response OmpR family regulator
LIYIRAFFVVPAQTGMVEDERLKLRRDVGRYRLLRGSISDPALAELLEEMIAEAETQLARLDARWQTPSQDGGFSQSCPSTDASWTNTAASAGAALLRIRDWRLDPRIRRAVSPTGKTVQLTKGEFDLLLTFITHADELLSRNELMELSRRRSAGPAERTIDVLIGRLRRKLEADPKHPAQIQTVRSEGYIFRSLPDA